MANKIDLEERKIELSRTSEYLRVKEEKMIAEMITKAREASKKAPKTRIPKEALPPSVDLSHYIQYVRHQGAYSCFAHATIACWDIFNEMKCPYSPNLSVNRWIWAWGYQFRRERVAGYDGRMYKCYDPYAGEKYLAALGCPTEGSELTDTWAVRWPTEDGDYEAPNYKLASYNPTAVRVDVNEFKMKLANGVPLRLGIPGHYVALVGYDDTAQRFKVLDSAGDRYGENGFWYINYSDLRSVVEGADFYTFVPPKSVPSARIRFTHSHRQDVYLWIGVEGKLFPKRIWPNGQRQDDSRNLSFTVTLPRGFIWPPAAGNRLFLEVYDSGGHYGTGGEMVEFTAAFCGHVFRCSELSRGPVRFNPYTRRRFLIP